MKKIQSPQLFDQDPLNTFTSKIYSTRAKFNDSTIGDKNATYPPDQLCVECNGSLSNYTGEWTCSNCGIVYDPVYGQPHTLMEKEKLNYKDYFYGEPLQHTVSNHIFYYQEAKTPKQRASFYRMARLNCLRDDQEQRICSALSCLQHLKAQFHFPSNWIQCAIQSTRKVIQIQKKQEDIHFIAVCALFIEARRNKFEITSAEILGASKVHANLNRMHKVLAQFAFVWGPVKHWVPTGKLKEKLEEVAKEYLPNLTPAEIHQTYKKCLELRKRAGRLRGSPISVIAALIYLQWQKYNLTQKQVAKKLGTSDMTIRGIKRQIEARLGEKFSLG